MCERFVRTHMPPEEEQLNEVLQLRSQGMTYKQIAEKTGHPQSTVAHWCQTNTPKSPQKVEVLMVNDFEPGMTVITLPIHKFEFYRKSDLLYFTYSKNRGSDFYEIRGTIIHRTYFPERGELYPHFIDMIEEKGPDFDTEFDSSLHKSRQQHALRMAQNLTNSLTNKENQLTRHQNIRQPQLANGDILLQREREFFDWARKHVDDLHRVVHQATLQLLDNTGIQADPESVQHAYERWESHQTEPPELTRLTRLMDLAKTRDQFIESLFEDWAKETYGIPRKHAKIALEINSLDAKKIKHFVDSGANNLQEFEQLHASGLATFAEFERVQACIHNVTKRTLELILPEWSDRGQSDQYGVRLENYKAIFTHLDVIAEWPSIKEMQEAIEVGFEVEEHKEYKRWISKLSNTNWELTHARINQFRQLEWNLDDLLRFDSPEDMALHALIEASPDMVSHAKLLENYKATHGTNLGNARNLHDRLQSPPFDTMVESDLDAGIIQKLAGTKAKRKSAPKPKKTAKKDAIPDVSKALVDLAKYPKLSASESKESERLKLAILGGDLEGAIVHAVSRLERISREYCSREGLELPEKGNGEMRKLIFTATDHALELTKNRKNVLRWTISTRNAVVHPSPENEVNAERRQLLAVLKVAEDMP